MPRKRTVKLTVRPEDLRKVRVPLPKKGERIHKHRKDRRSQETKRDLENLAEE